MKNLYYGDNLDVLRESIKDESVDLIYLDPPFNSKRGYNLLFKSPDGQESNAQIVAFEDSWHWNAQAEREFDEILHNANTDVAEMMQALRKFLGENDMMAYLTMMCNRLLELHRVLKSTGSLYLHCDPTASHYLKIVLDGVFNGQNFRNEVIWCYRGGGASKTDFGKRHDVIFRYSKTEDYLFNADSVRIPYQAEGLGRTDDAMWGKHKGTDKIYKPNPLGKIPEDWWLINILNANDPERLGYPTQKPLTLLERIIQASSNKGDIVLDPFCGCGTAVHAAEKLGRKWIGIDITHLAVSLIEKRLKDAFPEIKIEVHGTPKDLAGAVDLARRDKYQFQWWACSLVNAQPYQGKKKGADGGIDGLIYFHDDDKGAKKIIVSVKGGDNVGVAQIRDLAHVVEREKASMGLFVTLAKPTSPMTTEAVKVGYYEQATIGKKCLKIQILTIKGLLNGTEKADFVDWQKGRSTFKKAKTEQTQAKPGKLF